MGLFPPAREVLAAGAGELEGTAFPLLLNAIAVQARTLCLELKHNNLEKKIFFEDGVPVGCETNLLHETLGRFLVREEKITDEQYQAALGECASTGVRMGEWLVQQQLLAPYDLFRLMQKSLALKILDAFRWSSGRWRLALDAESGATPLKINPAQLVLTGCSSSLLYTTVTAALAAVAGERFALVPSPPHELGKLKLSGKDSRLLKAFEAAPDLGSLLATSALDDEEVLRRLYAFLLLGFVAPADEVARMPSPGPAPAAAPVSEAPAAPAPVPAARPGRSPEAVRDEVMGLFLRYRDLDPFDLLGVSEESNFAALREAFLAFGERFAPWSLSASGEVSAEVEEKAGLLFLAGARAFAELADAGRRSECVRRRQERAASRQVRRKGPDFTIRTDLLDGETQFGKGRALLAKGEVAGAIEHLQYAVDIDPRPLHRAWLGWAHLRRGGPGSAEAREAVTLLEGAAREAPRVAEIFFFLGSARRAAGDLEGAAAALRRAVQLAPERADYAKALAELA
ncbi:MAG: DUF4388 domain-containing protein [Deltaproteobacteria bacterium]|nr:DUF4388 domain-containing protein [Deltaproteobacteria bacterium]